MAMQLHVISNGKLDLQKFADKMHEIAPYVDYIHLREKTKTARELFNAVNYLGIKGISANKIVINDRADVAAVCKAGGVQLAYHSLPVHAVRRHFPRLRIGCSVHSVAEAKQAEASGADYVVFGHIYTTASKFDLVPKGVDALAKVVEAVTIPVIAIGGIKPFHIREIKQTGASGIAVMSSIVDAVSPLEAVQGYVKMIEHEGG